jgi:hypothetical protein
MPATINRELACLKRMFNVALKELIVLTGGRPLVNPMARWAWRENARSETVCCQRRNFDARMRLQRLRFGPYCWWHTISV